MRILYTATFVVLLPLLILRLFWRGRSETTQRGRWRERFACALSPDLPHGAIWIHAVSVGEAIAATPIVEYLQKNHSELPIVITTTTATGAITVAQRFGDTVKHTYFPYDLPWVLARFIARIEPDMLILMETELWPNLLNLCARNELPVLLANGRMSAKSTSRYALVRNTTAAMLDCLKVIAVQSQDDAERFVSLGAERARIEVTGSMKFDIELPPSTQESGQALRRFLGVSRATWMAASTRDGEEPLILAAFSILLQQQRDLILIIAPRHPQRFDAVAEICSNTGFRVARHSKRESCTNDTQIYLVDTMGELANFYAASDIAFVGGSLVRRGGHNVLEPASLGVPIIVGAHTFNFAEIVQRLRDAGALEVIRDPRELAQTVDCWLRDVEARDRAGAAGRTNVEQNRGAARRMIEVIERFL